MKITKALDTFIFHTICLDFVPCDFSFVFFFFFFFGLSDFAHALSVVSGFLCSDSPLTAIMFSVCSFMLFLFSLDFFFFLWCFFSDLSLSVSEITWRLILIVTTIVLPGFPTKEILFFVDLVTLSFQYEKLGVSCNMNLWPLALASTWQLQLLVVVIKWICPEMDIFNHQWTTK